MKLKQGKDMLLHEYSVAYTIFLLHLSIIYRDRRVNNYFDLIQPRDFGLILRNN